MTRTAVRFYRFGCFGLDVRERLLFREGQPISLQLKVFETLLALVEHHGHILEKSRLVRRLWPNTHVGSRSLAQNIFTLRRVLGGRHSEFIETVPRRGYRFIAPVNAWDDATHGADRNRVGGADPLNHTSDALAIRVEAMLPFKLLEENVERNSWNAEPADPLGAPLNNLDQVVVGPSSDVDNRSSFAQDLRRMRSFRVDSILDGPILQADKIQVTTQLVNAHNGAPLSADRFNGKLNNILSVKDAISQSVTQALRVKVSAAERSGPGGQGTEKSEAYRFYLKGRFHWSRRTPQGFENSVRCFEQAINQNPSCALAWSGLADCHILSSLYGAVPPGEAHARSLAAATRALEIDAHLVEPITSLAYISTIYEWDLVKAEQEFKRALAVNPNYATACHWYAAYLIAVDRREEAIDAIIRAQEIEPLSLCINDAVGWIFCYAGKYDLAIEQLRQTLEMYPDCSSIYHRLGLAYGQKRMYSEAIAALQRSVSLSPEDTFAEALLGYMFAVAGRRNESQKMLDRLRSRNYVSPYLFAMIQTGRGEYDLAFDALNRAFEERSNWLIYLNVNPVFEVLRSDARFTDLLRRLRL